MHITAKRLSHKITGKPSALLHFTDRVFFTIEGLWQPCTNQIYQHIFTTACAHFVSVSPFGNSHNISNTFITVIVIYD